MNFVVSPREFPAASASIGVEEGGDLSWGDVIGECSSPEVEDFSISDKRGGVSIFRDDVRFLEIPELRPSGFAFGDATGG